MQINQNLNEKNNILIQIHFLIKLIIITITIITIIITIITIKTTTHKTHKIGSRQHMPNRANFALARFFARGLPPLLIPPTHPPTPAPSHSRSAAAQQGLPPAPPLPPPAHCSSSGGRGPRLRLARPTSYLGFNKLILYYIFT